MLRATLSIGNMGESLEYAGVNDDPKSHIEEAGGTGETSAGADSFGEGEDNIAGLAVSASLFAYISLHCLMKRILQIYEENRF